jgi:serine/threonine-protein kinase
LTNGGFNTVPVLTPDERRIIYSSGLPNFNLFWKPIDQSRDEERLTTSPNAQVPGSVSPDGKLLTYVEYDSVTNADILVIPLDGDRTPRPFLKTRFSEGSPVISPDGRWIAYQSNASGRFEIYVSSFPEPGPPTQVTTTGGIRPVWSGNGRELFYQSNTRKMVVPVEPGPPLKFGDASMLFAGNYLGEGDLARDTGRFVMVKDNGQDAAGKTIYLVLNWFDELRAKLSSPAR